jgi:minor extracellular serine protease Vpr
MRRRRQFGPAALALSLMLAAALPAAASSSDEVEPAGPAPWDVAGTSDSEFVDDLWFVEFSAPPSARGGNPAAHANERARFQAEARAEGVDADQERDFTTLWNGVTVRADLDEIATIGQLRSVTAVYPVAVIDAPEPEEVSPALSNALAMTGADAVQSELGFTGEGLSVAIIDTGIDYNHQDLGGDGDQSNRIDADSDRSFDHPRISHAWDYVGDEFNAADPNTPPPAPNPDPFDHQGHGTHVAGITGASGDVTGVAPGVTFGAYKVIALGSTTADVIVDALEDAWADGMDIVNMSLGAAFVWGQEYPTTAASNELAAQGVAVVNSAGNSGGDGVYSLSAPANAHDIISVASADNTFFDAFVFEVEQLEDPIPYMEMSGAELPPTEGESEELAWVGRACVDSEGDALLGPEGDGFRLAMEGLDLGRLGIAAQAAVDAGADHGAPPRCSGQ